MPFVFAVLVLVAAPLTPVQQMTRAFENGRGGDAVRLALGLTASADAAERQAANLVLVLAAERRGDHDAVLEGLTRVSGLGDYGVYLGVGAHVGRRDCAAAESLAEPLTGVSPFASAAWGRVGACWLRAQDVARAGLAITRSGELARNRGQVAEASVARARLLRATRDVAGAGELLRSVLAEDPTTPAAREARVELGRMGMRVPDPTAEELVNRAAFERVRARGMARRSYRSALAHTKIDPVIRGRAKLGLVELDVIDKRYPAALTVLGELIAKPADASVKAHALFLRGDVLARRGKVVEALADFARACDETPAEPYAREAALTGTRLAYASRDLVRAKWFSDWLIAAAPAGTAGSIITEDGAIGIGHASSELKDGAFWYGAWAIRRGGDTREQFDAALASVDVRGSFGPGALYWRFRGAQAAGEIEKERELVRALLDVAPTSYYALAASEILCSATPDCPTRLVLPALPAPEEAPPPTSRTNPLAGVVTLYEAGLPGEAYRLTRMVPQSALADDDRLTVAWLAARNGDIHAANLATRRLAIRTRAEMSDPLIYTLAFPRPHKGVVDAVAQVSGIPSALIYAVIREESAFDVRAMSPRAARGLMQMMRLTALRIAREAKLRGFATRQLFEPQVSVRLGAQYISDLAIMWNGDVSAIAASYHAGEANVGRWRERLGPMPIDEFIEEIPYASTRRYVQKVIASHGIYRLLYGQTAGTMLKL